AQLEATGMVDYLSLTGGDGGLHHGPFPRPDGEWLDLIARMKARTHLPVMHAGRVTTPEMAEAALAAGALDVVLMTKAHIADPHFTRKAQEGRPAEIRYCTRCLQSCVGKMEAMTCIYNPVTSREAEWAELKAAPRRKRVVVVGAGPAGMEAALTAAARGHDVVVLEKGDAVGGQVRYASRAPHRRLFGRIWEYYEREAARTRLELRLEREADAPTILALNPDAVVIATGSRPRPAVLTGDGPQPLTVHAALDGAAAGAQHVVIVDREGFTRPIVVADALSAAGTRVQFLTPFLTVSPELNSMSREELHARLAAQNVQFFPGEDAAGWVSGELLVRNVLTAEARRILGVDAVVIACGSDPVNELGLALEGRVPELHVIGDANLPRTVEEATYQGGRVGRLL
ncbi:MAG: FAD-dependent oxidoreductase, partial [Armatimonadetes bacterium]|nr:FAD-dependent oxidoreductase [Armatimonadota bacterium]